MGFEGKDDLRAAGCPRLRAGYLIGVRTTSVNAKGRHSVIACKPFGAHHRDFRIRFPGGVGPPRESHFGIDGGKGTVILDAGA